jgi:hypothetical protein
LTDVSEELTASIITAIADQYLPEYTVQHPRTQPSLSALVSTSTNKNENQ